MALPHSNCHSGTIVGLCSGVTIHKTNNSSYVTRPLPTYISCKYQAYFFLTGRCSILRIYLLDLSLLGDARRRTNPGRTLTRPRQRTGDLAVEQAVAVTVMPSGKGGYEPTCSSSCCRSSSPFGCTENSSSRIAIPSSTSLQRRLRRQR